MFQRLKGAIDSRIAEEQARQKATTNPPVARSGSAARRSISRTGESPAARARRPKPKEDGTPVRGPDPAEFEAAFVIEDESEEPSRVGTPSLEKSAGDEMVENNTTAEAESGDGEKETEKPADTMPKSPEMSVEVRTKLRKLEKLESKYQELLRSYRIAHARAISIEPFEKTLKEHTPLAGIADPDALVEYLNQLNLKGDMVMDELKRVTTDRDDYKKKLEESEKQATATREELATLKSSGDREVVAVQEKADTVSINTPTASVKSPVSSVLGIFSPKQKPEPTADNKDVNEEFFSYDDEVPKLQTEVKEKSAEVEELKSMVSKLESDLATAQESSSGLVESLEKATRDLNESKDAVAEGKSRQEKIEAQTEEIKTLNEKLEATKSQIAVLEADLAKQKTEAEEKISALKSEVTSHKESATKDLATQATAHEETEKLRQKLNSQIKDLEKSKATDSKRIQELSDEVKLLNQKAEEVINQDAEDAGSKPPASEVPAAPTTTGAAKKKNKKKKKGAAAASSTSKEEPAESVPVSSSPTPTAATTEVQAEISKLKEEIADRDAQIVKLQTKRKTEADLREELENMQENFLSIGQEHVEAKDKIKELQGEKIALQGKINRLEQEFETYKTQSKDSDKIESDLKSLTAEYEELKSKSATLQTDLGAAQQLATSRYRDLADLRDVLQKAQPELKMLRAENATLKTTKDELTTRTSELRRLEVRERDLKSDMASFKKQAADRETEIRTLNEKVTQETNSRLRLEDQNRVSQRDLRKSESEKIQLQSSLEKTQSELAKIQSEVSDLRPKIQELESQVERLTTESTGLREEMELRGSQYTSAQGLLSSMRDQTSEISMQLKEAQSQSESLEEELAEVQRLLSERTREAETMRRLLADVDDRADSKVREMRERMEAAIEERDRAEDEASTNARRRAREVDELKTKIREFERDLKRATDDRDELARSEKDWKRRRDELEAASETSSKEVNEIRTAMSELRDALDGSEKQVRDAEKQRSDLRRILDEANQRYEKLQKEFKGLQAKANRFTDVSASGRSSIDSGRAGSPNGKAAAGGDINYVYLKTILLQFLEQKDRKVQADLVKTVLGQLLHFDKKDQEKWIAAISAK